MILTKTVYLSIEFCPSHPLTSRLGIFFYLLPNQNYIIANACIVLYFWACRAVLQTSLIGRISVQSLSCALLVHMAFFLPIQIKKGQNYKEKYIYDRNKVQIWCLHFILPCNWAGVAVPHSSFCKLWFPGAFPIHRARMMVFSASYSGCLASQERYSSSLGRNEAGSSWVIPEWGICKGMGILREAGNFAALVSLCLQGEDRCFSRTEG